MAFSAAEVEDGTGLETALVYEQASAATAWLKHAARGLTALDTATAANQDKALLAATVFAEDLIRHLVDGVPVKKKQALVFPRIGCTSHAGRTFESDEIPPDLLYAIRHFAELQVVTPLLRHPAGDLDAISSHSDITGSISYRVGSGAHSVARRYSTPWAYIVRLFDPCKRRETWAA